MLIACASGLLFVATSANLNNLVSEERARARDMAKPAHALQQFRTETSARLLTTAATSCSIAPFDVQCVLPQTEGTTPCGLLFNQDGSINNYTACSYDTSDDDNVIPAFCNVTSRDSRGFVATSQCVQVFPGTVKPDYATVYNQECWSDDGCQSFDPWADAASWFGAVSVNSPISAWSGSMYCSNPGTPVSACLPHGDMVRTVSSFTTIH